MGEPKKNLEGWDELKQAVLLRNHYQTDWFRGENKYRVRSDVLVKLVETMIEETGRNFICNSDVCRSARIIMRLPLPKPCDLDKEDNGTPLSVLVYNAQAYRRSEKLIREGFFPLTEESLKDIRGKKAHLCDGTPIFVREIGGRLHAFKSKNRYALHTGVGTPVKIQK